MTIIRLRHIVTTALILSILVVMLGAYTRLTDAGLGCPDWPGCYGHLVLPSQSSEGVLSSTQSHYGIVSVEPRKAWTEMIHRYAAGTLALLIFFIGFQSIKKSWPTRQRWLPRLLMALVIFQALLGMWTVTLKLLPIVVMSHLLGGILIFSCLACLRIQMSGITLSSFPSMQRGLVGGACLLLFLQIALGGWVSANYAGIACIGFPQCNGQWIPKLHFAEGFNLFSPVTTQASSASALQNRSLAIQNYQGGILDNSVRVTIQWIHRLGAFITLSYLVLLAFFLLRQKNNRLLHRFAAAILTLSGVQLILGIINVLFRLPLSSAVAHNGVAALLMGLLLMLFGLTTAKDKA